jgi:thiol-disulfide isomerase/thioredoxin
MHALHTGSQPWPDYGGNITKVHNLEEWDGVLKPANRLVVVDAYALWCPPCKAAAPVYAKLSEEFENCCFAKVDVDNARDVSQRLGIQAMPTFKVRAHTTSPCFRPKAPEVRHGSWSLVSCSSSKMARS